MERENELTNLGIVGDLIGVNGKIIELTDFDKELNNIPVHARAVFLVSGKSTQIDPLNPFETDPLIPFQIDPLIPAEIDPLKIG